MPGASEILTGLTRIATDAFALAVLWHLVIAAILLALLLGWRPSRRLVATGLAVPLATVSVLAWTHGNPFNGGVFAILAAVLAGLGLRAPRTPIPAPGGWSAVLGALLVGFAWVYPHFLEARSPLAYLYGAPVGLLPCPTLALAIGLALLTWAPGGRAWSAVLAGAGIFYGLFGALHLGVTLDIVLLAGAFALAVHLRSPALPRHATRPG